LLRGAFGLPFFSFFFVGRGERPFCGIFYHVRALLSIPLGGVVMANPAVKSLNVVVSKGSQSVSYVELLQAGDFKLRIEIKSDSYAAQSYARILVWSPAVLDWHFVECVPSSLMATPVGLIYLPRETGVHKSHFLADRGALVARMQLVLF
jgi:hypothetical protein